MKRAFALIELLVVIAIIAILAAILFPVFAQAKAQAKKAAGLSNDKQLNLGVLMYENDADDMLPPSTEWNPQNSPGNNPLTFGNGWFANWGFLTAPYIKNAPIFYDPQVGNTPTVAAYGADIVTAMSFPDFGYNYVYLSPWKSNGAGGTAQYPINGTLADEPAQTIMLAERGSALEEKYGTGAFWGFTFSYTADGPLLNATVEVPNCNPIPQYCASNWGVGDFSDATSTFQAGDVTGGVAVRAGNQSIVTFLDGHAKTMTPGALAAGTTWTQTLPAGSLVWSAAYPQAYLWSTNHAWTNFPVW